MILVKAIIISTQIIVREKVLGVSGKLDNLMVNLVWAAAAGGLLASTVIHKLWERALASYEFTVESYKGRVAAGLQPQTPIVNFFSMDHQEKFLTFMNLGYLVFTCLLYLFMVKREKAFRLKRVLTIYNLANVIISGYVSFEILRYKVTKQPSFICNSGPPGDPGLSYVFVIYYLQKFFEYSDTYFFILRKSFRQVTFLHLFHHASITVIVGSLLPFDYDGDMYLPILVNSLVHVMVYLHYFCTCIGIQSWWSPFLTSFQMGQFGVIFAQSILAFWEGPECGSPDFSKLLMMVYMGSMLVLFSDFFIKRYILKKQAYDMCGVIKSVEYTGGQTCSSYHGNTRLSANGVSIVRMPRTFREGMASVMYCYHLTPIQEAMPELHITQEITRTVKQGGGHAFMIGGGKANGLVSWMVTVVAGDEHIRMH